MEETEQRLSNRIKELEAIAQQGANNSNDENGEGRMLASSETIK